MGNALLARMPKCSNRQHAGRAAVECEAENWHFRQLFEAKLPAVVRSQLVKVELDMAKPQNYLKHVDEVFQAGSKPYRGAPTGQVAAARMDRQVKSVLPSNIESLDELAAQPEIAGLVRDFKTKVAAKLAKTNKAIHL